MAVINNQKEMVKRLRKQVRLLQKKEEAAKNKLRSALLKMRKLNRSYKNKLASKMRVMRGRVADAEVASYAKAVIRLERQMINAIERKGKALASALKKVEKKFTAKLTKSLSKKGKKSSRMVKTKKVSRKK